MASHSTPGQFTRENVRENNEFLTRVVKTDLPVVAISNPTDCQTVCRVNADYDTALATVLSHLKELGHRHIAVYGGPRIWPAFEQRIDAFLRQAAALDLDCSDDVICDYPFWAYQNPQGIVDLVRDHLLSHRHITAGITVSGSAQLVRNGVQAAGLSCPEDVSLISPFPICRFPGRANHFSSTRTTRSSRAWRR